MEGDSDYSFSEHERSDDEQRRQARRKRKQVKRACGNCRKAHSACGKERPCPRCVSRKEEASCVDLPRKKRKITDVGGSSHNHHHHNHKKEHDVVADRERVVGLRRLPPRCRKQKNTSVQSPVRVSVPRLVKKEVITETKVSTTITFTTGLHKTQEALCAMVASSMGPRTTSAAAPSLASSAPATSSHTLKRKRSLGGGRLVKLEPHETINAPLISNKGFRTAECEQQQQQQQQQQLPEFLPLSNPLLAHLPKLEGFAASASAYSQTEIASCFTSYNTAAAAAVCAPPLSKPEEPKFLFAEDFTTTAATSATSLPSSSYHSSPCSSLASSLSSITSSSPTSSPPYSTTSSFSTSPQSSPSEYPFGLMAGLNHHQLSHAYDPEAEENELDSLFSNWNGGDIKDISSASSSRTMAEEEEEQNEFWSHCGSDTSLLFSNQSTVSNQSDDVACWF